MKKYDVETHTGTVKVKARGLEIDDQGLLVFRQEKGGPIVAAFAPGQWLSFVVTGVETAALGETNE